MTLLEIIVGGLLLIGAIVRLLASIGMLRFGDIYMRMHAATKASVTGLGLMVIAAAIFYADPLLTVKLIALSVIYFFTSPTGSQVLASAAHQAGYPRVKETWIDELADAEAAAQKAEAEAAQEDVSAAKPA
ncbi:MAG: monovalent cation/proton antiporter subunit MnhG/PhaG [Chloroflexi bacterium OLB15]|nr:MAG: monovalent cation/proton antiporter subunit MnhG/PhaG [Chloroflexi bacterium OLB15]